MPKVLSVPFSRHGAVYKAVKSHICDSYISTTPPTGQSILHNSQ